jgi:hypothetical protein
MIKISPKLNIRGYKTSGDRKRAITMLKKIGYDHFTRYMDAQTPFALMYAKVKIY